MGLEKASGRKAKWYGLVQGGIGTLGAGNRGRQAQREKVWRHKGLQPPDPTPPASLLLISLLQQWGGGGDEYKAGVSNYLGPGAI